MGLVGGAIDTIMVTVRDGVATVDSSGGAVGTLTIKVVAVVLAVALLNEVMPAEKQMGSSRGGAAITPATMTAAAVAVSAGEDFLDGPWEIK